MAGLTHRERRFARVFAEEGSVTRASQKAGYTDVSSGSHALKRPDVLAEVARIQSERLFNEVLPLAVQVHIDLLSNPATPAGARVQAVKLAYDRTLGSDQAAENKQPHEMTPQELQKALDDARLKAAALESVKADRARPVIDGDAASADDIFG